MFDSQEEPFSRGVNPGSENKRPQKPKKARGRTRGEKGDSRREHFRRSRRREGGRAREQRIPVRARLFDEWAISMPDARMFNREMSQTRKE